MKRICSSCENNILDLLYIIEKNQHEWYGADDVQLLHTGKIRVTNGNGKNRWYKFRWDGRTLKFRGLQATFSGSESTRCRCNSCNI